jgi:hypothetical protein
MTGVLGRFVSLEMALLGLCELALSFLVIYGMLPGPDMLPVSTGVAGQVLAGSAVLNTANLDLAAVLACTVVVIAAAIGLYRPEICIERRRRGGRAAGLSRSPGGDRKLPHWPLQP